VDTANTSWGNGNGNANQRGISVETEGCATPPHAEPMTEPMVNTFARLYRWCAEVHGIPYRPTESYNTPGFGYHRMAGGPATGCPCDVRLRMRPEILRRAQQGAPAPAPEPPPTRRSTDLITSERAANGNLHIWTARGSVAFYRWRDRQTGRWNPADRWAVFADAGKEIIGLSSGLDNDNTLHVFVDLDDRSSAAAWQKAGASAWSGSGPGAVARFQAFAKL
jgi:hypothetical protein